MESAICREKIEGMFLGVAIGEALGMSEDGKSLEEIKKKRGRVEEYRDPTDNTALTGKRKAGMWTDSTQLTLVVAESLIAKGKIDMDDLAKRHVQALKKSNLGWDASTKNAVQRLMVGDHWKDSGMPQSPDERNGNAVIRKMSPLAAYIAAHKNRPIRPRVSSNDLVNQLIEVTCMTHRTRVTASATLTHGNALFGCLCAKSGFSRGVFLSRNGIVSRTFDLPILDPGGFEKERFPDRMAALEKEDWTKKSAAEISAIFGGGDMHVYNSLPFCYAFFLKAPDSIETLYEVVSAGGDTDGNGSIVGAMLGALNGTKIFPQHLIDGLWQKNHILATARRFCRKFKIPD